jgi:hypothetical protein
VLRTSAPLIGTLGVRMILIDTSPVQFYSHLDEMTFYEWVAHIPGVKCLDDGFLEVKSKWLSKTALCDLIALMTRYGLPMGQLKQFVTKKNEAWFKSKEEYWYAAIFEDHADS